MDLHKLPGECFDYQRPRVIVPPFDFLDLDLALVDAQNRMVTQNEEIELVNNRVTGKLMEYTVLVPL